MRNRTTAFRGRRKGRRSENVDLRIVINRRRQTALRTAERVDNSKILESSGNKEDAKDIAELAFLRPQIDYSDILVSSDEMNKDDRKIDFIGVNRQSMFVEDELLEFSTDNEASDPNVSNCGDIRDILNNGFLKSDGHSSRQVQENELSITSLNRVCDSTKDADKRSETDREKTGSDEIREEGEVYEDEYEQNEPIEALRTIQKCDIAAVVIKSKKIRQQEDKDKRGSKRLRDNESQNVNNNRPHFLPLSAKKEVSAPNVLHSKGKREISNKGFVNNDCYRSQGNVPSVTSRKFGHVAIEGLKMNEHIHELGDLKLISSDRVCETNRIADEGSETDREKTRSSELREEGEIYEDVQKQSKEPLRTTRNHDHDVVGVISKKRRQPETNDERQSKRRRDCEPQNVKNSRLHLLHKTSAPERKRYTDISNQRSPRPSHSHLDDSRYISTYRWTRKNKNDIHDSLTEKRCHQSLNQNQRYAESKSILRAKRSSGHSSCCSPIRRCDRRRYPPNAVSCRRDNRERSLFVQRRENIDENSGEPGNAKYAFQDLNNKSLHDDGKGKFDFASKSRSWERDVRGTYRRNRERSSLESLSRNKSNRSSARHKSKEDDEIPRFVSDNRHRTLTDDPYRSEKDNRKEVTNYGSQTPLERCDRSTHHMEEREWEDQHVSQEMSNLHDKNVSYPRNDNRYSVNAHSEKNWEMKAMFESRVSSTQPYAQNFGIIPKTRKVILDRGQNIEHGFLGTLQYLSRPCHTNDEIANILATRSDELDQYLRKEDKCPKLWSLIDILVRCVECKVCTTSKRNVMYILKRSKFFERKDVIDSLKQMRTSPTKDCAEDRFLFGLLLVMKTMIDTVNLEENDTTVARSLIESIIKHRNEDVILQTHSAFLKDISESFELKEQRKSREFREELFAETLPILPGIDLIRLVKETDIPKHEIGQKFDSDRQYISHMFVLFREDFIRPLCKGIRDYISHIERGSIAKFRSTDVRLFQEVQLHSTDLNADNGIVWALQVKFNSRGNIYIPSVLQYGSLLCLSPDDFKTMYYATVVNRDCLRHGNVSIKFLENNDMAAHIDTTFVMLESRAFYEAYSHTLSLLKELALGLVHGERTLPFGKYLLGNTSDIEHPKYLEECGEMSFSCLIRYGDCTIAPIKNIHAVKVQDSTTWPSSADLGLDISQHKALKLALTKEISLIQGPPGTGKTTMGIRIAELLLSNKHAWRGHKRKPMLLVSYTNHALDQFLQLLLNTPVMTNCLTEDVVRVGSRCEIQHLDKFTLKSHRKLQRPHFRTFRANYAQLKSIERNILALKDYITFYKECLVHEMTFRELDVMPPWMNTQLVGELYKERHRPNNKTSLWIWLDLPSLLNRRDPSCQRIQSTQSDYTTEKDIVNEDFERVLDDDEDEWGITIMPEDDLARRPLIAIDEGILREDPYYRDMEKNQISALIGSIKHELSVKDRMTKEETERLRYIWQLSTVDRWRLYRYWVFEATFNLYQELRRHEREYDDASRRYREARNLLDCKIMKEACIVAMTTTAAARYTRMLQEVAPPVVIIEEAAQVSEQHVLGALSSASQHLIMIGDHQQLRPAYNDYNLARMHHTDVSLFERLIRNGMCYQQLENQHRMRPEIASLLVPHIYKSLENHESVFKYSDIRGVATNLYFIAHEQEEDNFDESLSHSNKYEAEFISKLYRHLRLQGYFQHEITVLSLYKDQVQLLRNKIRELEQTDEFLMNIRITEQCTDGDVFLADLGAKAKLQNKPEVRITAVDNFQGEENRIILLSLVRSNKNGRIGFLKAANRVCVALSRAREGLFVIGNMTCLRQASDLWEKVISKAETQGLCGKHLELKCVKHKENKMIVQTPQDFEKYTDGGCNQPCTFRMDCGHTCSRKCHNDDPDHKIPCKRSCQKYCEKGHCHEKLCHESIGKCTERHEVILPRCGHTKVKRCFEDVNEVKCDERCHKELTCGHICQRRCGEECNDEDDCTELVKVTGKCGHECQVACSHQKHFRCKIPCRAVLDCGHLCSGTCGKCHQGRLHMPCRKKCERILICGHHCIADCTEVCPPCEKECMNACEHRKCSKKCGEPCIVCREPCQWECRRWCPSGFKCTRTCYEDCNRSRCNEPCGIIIPNCLHMCIALNCEKCICKECEESFHFEIFFGKEDDPRALFYMLEDCGHIFELSGLDEYMDKKDLERQVGLKVCPRCRTPILHSKRYGNVIKECSREIDAVKRKIGYHYISQDRKEVWKEVAKVEIEDDRHFFKSCISQARNNSQLNAIHSQINFYLSVIKSIADVNSKYKDILLEEKRQDMLKELHGLQKWTLIKRFRFSEQELSEFKLELTRVRLSLRVDVLICGIRERDSAPQRDTEWTKETKKKLDNGEKLNKKTVEDIKIKLKQLDEKYPHSGLGISDDERIMILKAMGFSQKGHCYKCKNGHLYAITECGGAMEEGNCPECREIIGGRDHQSRDDNQVASEMDGAQFSAWSEQSNMQNL
ncbi:hypothetical protein CHS0354_025336 [Potamilus streckersoni]|uniref:RZ-type domain-containing protein n=1 Tax=Potamilus streckersoni TaxID=2493646 RepID=A0AAE0SQ40_9BIVA|nr:hypothetical protein CHS0354_025336 [Potamilus streckersoni]